MKKDISFDITSEHLFEPILTHLEDKNVSEIVLNRPKVIFVERSNQFHRYEVPEFGYKRLIQLFQLIANENHQELDEKKPFLSGSLTNGSRIQLVIPPISPCPAFSIRKKNKRRYDLNALLESNFFENTQLFDLNKNRTQDEREVDKNLLQYHQEKRWRDFIILALQSRKNIVISGATSSGKTTFLNACLHELPHSERLLILEDTREVKVFHENALHLVAHRNQQGLSQVTMQDLVQCSLRLRPDRIIVGEVRGKELLDYIGASLTGHAGAITTIHAENPKIAFIRMCQMYKLNALSAMTDQDIYNEIKQAVDIIFQLRKTHTGRCLESVYLNTR